ncbi:10245_t:CDS:2, partial [Racocetra persica]
TELGAFAASAAIASLKKKVSINSVFFRNVLQTDNIALYLAHHVSLRAGLPIEILALTINRLCKSSFQDVINAVQEIGSADLRWEVRFGLDLKLEDSLVVCLVDQYSTRTPMVSLQKIWLKNNITREQADKYAKLTKAARYFFDEITPVEVKTKKGPALFSRDKHSQTTIQTLSKQPSIFVKDTGIVTVCNASGISDGAVAIIVASEDAIKEYEIVPLACIVSYSVTGIEPTIIGIGPVPAIKEALKRANLKLLDIGLVEINEVFAPQYLSVKKELGLDHNITNANS